MLKIRKIRPNCPVEVHGNILSNIIHLEFIHIVAPGFAISCNTGYVKPHVQKSKRCIAVVAFSSALVETISNISSHLLFVSLYNNTNVFACDLYRNNISTVILIFCKLPCR